MVSVELIYDPDCPHLPHARAALLKAFDQADIPPAWIEWDRQSADSPAHVRGYGSPTILVDGLDVAGIPPATVHRAAVCTALVPAPSQAPLAWSRSHEHCLAAIR